MVHMTFREPLPRWEVSPTFASHNPYIPAGSPCQPSISLMQGYPRGNSRLKVPLILRWILKIPHDPRVREGHAGLLAKP